MDPSESVSTRANHPYPSIPSIHSWDVALGWFCWILYSPPSLALSPSTAVWARGKTFFCLSRPGSTFPSCCGRLINTSRFASSLLVVFFSSSLFFFSSAALDYTIRHGGLDPVGDAHVKCASCTVAFEPERQRAEPNDGWGHGASSFHRKVLGK